MDSKTLMAFALMILIYMYFFQPKPGAVHQPIASNTIEIQKHASETFAEKKGPSLDSAEAESKLRSKILRLTNDKVALSVNGMGEIQSAEFLKFKAASGGANEAFGFEGQPINISNLRITGVAPKFDLISSDERHLHLNAKSDYFEAQRTVELSDSNYQLLITDEVKNKSSRSLTATLTSKMIHITHQTKAAGCGAMFGPQADIQELVYLTDGTAHRSALAKITETSPVDIQEVMAWAGISHKYFFFGLVPENTSLKSLSVTASNSGNSNSNDIRDTAELGLADKQIAPGESAVYKYSFYIGPKQLAELNAVQPELFKTIDYGDWIGPIARFLLDILHLFYSIIPNYGVAIILLTVLVKMALYPLAKKSAISMKRLQRIQPKMKEIREKYKNDKQRINLETMKLYKEEKVNPVGGCLPLLIQMPVFFALYRVFYASIELRQAPFFGWIKDLAVHDPYFVTPVLMTALMWYQQKMTPMPPADEENEAVRMQRAMMKWMPIFFGAIMIFLPAGLTLYFLVSSFITILQTAYLNKKLHTHIAPMGI